MNYKLISLIVIAVATTIISQDLTKVDAQVGNLTLNITGFENDEGSVKIALSNSKEEYSTKGQAFRGAIEVIVNKSARHIFDTIPFGTYAIKIYHDENNSDELDTNFIGVPSEDYGFSNNAKGSFGPASWKDAQFKFDQDSMVVEINID